MKWKSSRAPLAAYESVFVDEVLLPMYQPYRREREGKELVESVDRVFGGNAIDETWMGSAERQSALGIEIGAIETLCDTLLGGEGRTSTDILAEGIRSSDANAESNGTISPWDRISEDATCPNPDWTLHSLAGATAPGGCTGTSLPTDTIPINHKPRLQGGAHHESHTSYGPCGARGARERYSLVGVSLLVVAFVLSGFCLHKGLSPSHVTTKPIEELQVGDRVVGSNPLREDVEANASSPDASSWRRAKLHLTGDDGHSVEIDLLRPSRWFQEMGAEEGATIVLDLPELGAVGEAEVLYLGPCPDINPGPGNVVTATFKHSSADTVDLYVDGGEPIGTTKNHPIWSEDPQCFVRVDELNVGERVRTRLGISRVVAIETRPGRETVYNIEVHAEHVYEVGDLGVLAHNKPMKAPKRTLAIDYNKYPDLADNIWQAQQAGHPTVLTRGGDRAASRAAALDGIPNIKPLSRDEYPFASTREGGAGSWVGHIPKSQQNSQGALLKNFFKKYGIEPGDTFEVLVTNHPGG